MFERPATRPLALAVCLSLITAACGVYGRPSVDEWRPLWDEVRSVMPTLEELGTPPDEQLCGEALVGIREIENDLTPTPDAAIDDVVEEWLDVAEEAMFDCPPATVDVPDLDAAYAELRRLEAEVEVVLSIDVGT